MAEAKARFLAAADSAGAVISAGTAKLAELRVSWVEAPVAAAGRNTSARAVAEGIRHVGAHDICCAPCV